MKRLKSSIPNGGAPLGQFPVLRDIFDTENKDAIEALLTTITDGETQGVILSGCEVSGTSGNFAISAGYVYLDGKVLRYPGGSGFSATRYLQKASDTEESGTFADTVVRAYIDVEAAEDAGSAPGGGVQYVTVTFSGGGQRLVDLLITINDQATTTSKGIAEIATQSEVNTGSDSDRYVTPSTLNGRTATETRSGIAEIATQAEVNTGTDDTKIVTPLKAASSYISNDGNTGSATAIKTKIIQVGTWNMDTKDSQNVNVGVDITKIRSVNIMIRNDPGTFHDLLNPPDANSLADSAKYNLPNTGGTFIQIIREIGGVYDSINYDSTAFNRGYIVITYEE